MTIKTIECAIVDKAWARLDRAGAPPARPARRWRLSVPVPPDWLRPQQLARAGHRVHVFEKNARAGGLLRYGIPDFKMEKHLIDRRVQQMEAEGVTFHYGTHIGVTQDARHSSAISMRCC